ncbi:hypothetical protein QQF64_007043 [Cirrhinus molitorella]|uniref:Uncharacterized protein n=1 Tax=Cirrhinus molitorella TaxID=172907 RepID=A0ABR3M9J1_9TELE
MLRTGLLGMLGNTHRYPVMFPVENIRKRGRGFVRVLLVKCTKICLMFIYGCSLIVWINCAARSRASDMFTVHWMARLRSGTVASRSLRRSGSHPFAKVQACLRVNKSDGSRTVTAAAFPASARVRVEASCCDLARDRVGY